ncbi:PEP-CTERM sorting domain-containing protein [Singulisphaera sp. Ch08]|uniref:PEP-CTERM sorting domain-containing protein n=1 Tax=Singulisphaera sp. Ch08 TaxID=3120278 RepID=A0AAU7CDE0_9BACT
MTRTYVKGLAVIAAFLALTSPIAPASTILNLTEAGNNANETAAIGGNFIVQQTTLSNGTGVLDSFVRLRAEGRNTSEQGYNTDFRPLQFDEKSSPAYTHSLLLSDVPIVNVGGTDYRQFVLDINEKHGETRSLLSLNQVQIFLRDFGDLGGAFVQSAATSTTPPVIAFVDPFSSEVFRLNNNNSSFFEIQLNAALNSRTNPGDMFLYVADAAFQTVVGTNPDRQYVYLYSQFGSPPGAYATNGKYEEWAILKNSPNPVPEPSTVALALTGLGTLGVAGLRRRRSCPVSA